MSKNTARKPWTRPDIIIAINLYCKTPFGKIHVKNPDIINLAKKIGRTPGSVSYKLANFASLDTSLKRKGASHHSRLDQEVWNDFFKNMDVMALKSEWMMSRLTEETSEFEFDKDMTGRTKTSLVKTRVNQHFFRQMILASYNNTCCVTGLSIPELLIASHIAPWSENKKNRLNPRNGLCLNALHDQAFDKGFITISQGFRVILSPQLKRSNDVNKKHDMLTKYDGKMIAFPSRFLPDQTFLEYHRNHIFRKAEQRKK